MTRFKAGEFEIDVWSGGWPIVCEIFHREKKIAQINTLELRDIEYVISRARSEARAIAKKYDKDYANEY